MAVVIHSESLGTFLGTFLGLGLWSKFETGGQPAAPTFANAKQAEQCMAEWIDQPRDVRCIEVETDMGTYASVDACVLAGLPPWSD